MMPPFLVSYVRQIAVAGCCCLAVSPAGGQIVCESASKIVSGKSGFSLVYRLSPTEAEVCMQQKKIFDPNWLHTLVDTLWTISPVPGDLPYGYYLLVRAEKEDLVAEYYSNPSIRVTLLNTERGFACAVSDANGQPINEAKVLLKGKKVAYSTALGCYLSKKRKKGGLLKIHFKEEVILLDIAPESGYQKPRRWRTRPVLGFPYRTKQQLHWKITKIKDGEYGHYLRNKRRDKRRTFYWPMGGYIALNQPKYQPGDTLRLGAYLTDRHQKPVDQEVTLSISGGNKHLVRKLLPQKPGEFTFLLPLADSLQLDEVYYMELSTIKRHRTGKLLPKRRKFEYSITQDFRYEDYQLDAMTYSIKPSKSIYEIGETAELQLVAKDPNGQPVPDVDVKLVFTTKSASPFQADEVYVKDTLWQHRTMMPPTVNFTVQLPDSVLPKATLSILAQAYFTNTAGEMQQQNCSFTVHQVPEKGVEMSIKGGFFRATFSDTTHAPDRAVLKKYYEDQEVKIDTILLPFRQILDPLVSSYDLVYGKKSYAYDPDLEWPRVTMNYARVNDSLLLRLRNPNQLDLHYWISQDKKIIAEGNSKSERFTWLKTQAGPYLYIVHYSCIWGGKQRQGDLKMPYFENLLNVTTDQPESLSPGDAVNINIKVTDISDKPVQGAHVAAGAYNSQFGANSVPYQAPNIHFKARSTPKIYPDFIVEDDYNSAKYRVKLTEDWVLRFQLKDSMYYRLRYSGCFYQEITDIPLLMPRDTTHHNIGDIKGPLDAVYLAWPQFAPWVIRDHQAVPAHLIYDNGLLVYFSGNSDQQPYSFYARPGWNKIAVRTHDAEYTLDSIWMESGKKYHLAFNESCIKVGKVSIKSVARPDSLLGYERELLRNSMLLLRQGNNNFNTSVWSSQTRVHRLCDNRYNHTVIVGPFQPNQEIQLLSNDHFYTRFNFEPGFEYLLSEGRERLYASKMFTNKYILSKSSPSPALKQFAWGVHQIYQPLPKSYQYINGERDRRGAGNISFELPPQINLLAIGLKNDKPVKGPYRGDCRTIDGLIPGQYTLLLYNQNKEVATVIVEVRRDELTFKRLTQLVFQKATPETAIDSFFFPRPIYSARYLSGSVTRFSPIISGDGLTLISGQIKDETGETLIGASIKLVQGGILVRGGITDFDGNYRLQVSPGIYDIEVSYTGYHTVRQEQVILSQGMTNLLDFTMKDFGILQEVLVMGYRVPLIQQDQTSMGYTLTSEQIRNLPTRSINSITATTAGTSSIDGGEVNIKGSRANSNNYYIDGIKVPGAPPINREDVEQVQLRSTFRDYAYFQPLLTTNARGEATFKTVFPDDITAWKTFVLAVDGQGRGGSSAMTTKAFKKVSAQLAVPRFAIVGDRFDMAGLTNNRSGDSIQVNTTFKQEGQVVRETTQRIAAGLGEFATVEASAALDSMTLAYEMRSSLNTDGEVRKVPVLPLGTKENVGTFLFLERDTTFSLPIDPNLGSVTVYAENSPIELLLEDIKYLKEYPYGCNEQTASRLIALLLLKKINALRGLPLGDDKLVRQCIARLQGSQSPAGYWGWWSSGAQNTWMTAYVLKALQQAKLAGFTVTALDRGIIWLQQYAPSATPHDQRYALIALRDMGVNIDCNEWLQKYQVHHKDPLKEDRYTALTKLRIQQLCDLPLPKDSLLQYLQPHIKGGLSCPSGQQHWYNSQSNTTLLAYDIAEKAGWADITKGIRRYWLSDRSPAHAHNTIETAQVLLRLLPQLMAKDSSGGAINSPGRLVVAQQVLDTFPKKIIVAGNGQQSILVQKTGREPLILGIWQTVQNPAPAPKTDLFDVNTKLQYDGRTVENLRRGEACQLIVTVQVKQAADYVMIEVPIPAGCGYGEKRQANDYRYAGGASQEVHREYFKDRTAIFCERLDVGTYTYTIELEPRFSGRFALNSARAEQMYFPILYGRNGGRVVEIGK